VEEIIKQRFDNPAWDVFSNIGDKEKRGIKIGGSVFYPHIVVLKMGSSEIVGVGEIETEETFNPDKVSRWQLLSKAVPSFWLYIPKSKLEETRELIRDFKLKRVLLRIWDMDEKGIVSITDI